MFKFPGQAVQRLRVSQFHSTVDVRQHRRLCQRLLAAEPADQSTNDLCAVVTATGMDTELGSIAHMLEAAVEGNIVADFPLCNKSFNCSYAGHDL